MSSERTSTPQTPRAAIGAPKTSARSARSCRTAAPGARRGDVDVAGRVGGARARDGRAPSGRRMAETGGRDYLISSSALTMPSSRGGVELGGARLARARGEDVSGRTRPIVTFSWRLPSFDVIVIASSGVSSAPFGAASTNEAARAWVTAEIRFVDLRLVDLLGGRGDLLPGVLFLAVLVLRLHLLERRRDAVADQLEPGRVEGAGVEEILLAVVARRLLQVVGERRFDGDDHRLRQVARVDRALAGRLADRQRGLRRPEPMVTVAAGLSRPYCAESAACGAAIDFICSARQPADQRLRWR